MAKNTNLTLLEEFNAEIEIRSPHLLYKDFSIANKKFVAYSVLSRKPEEILLINSSGFLVDAVFAGLTEKQIEFIAKNAPIEYKKNILELLYERNIDSVFEIAKSMDDDLGKNSQVNQQRINNVIRYISDNQIAFKF